MIWVRGVEYGTATALAARFQVTVWTIYKWRDPSSWDNPDDALPTTRINGRDYSPVPDAARCELAKRDTPRGRPRKLDSGMIAA